MIESLEVKNLLGFSYNMNFNAGHRPDKSFNIKGSKLFATFQVATEQNEELYKHSLNALRFHVQ